MRPTDGHDLPVEGSPVERQPDRDGSSRVALSFTERCLIEQLIEDGTIHGCTAIAHHLRRDRTTIWRELRRGIDPVTGQYAAIVGQQTFDESKARPKERKLAAGTPLADQVEQWLRQRCSPEQIAGRLVVDHPDEPEMHVSHETIYQHLYLQARGGLRSEVAKALRTGRTRRITHGRTSQQVDRTRFKDGMVNIADRPEEADDRTVPGHWEGDLITGAFNKSAIGTLVERTTGFVALLHLDGDHTAATVADAIIAKFPDIPELLRRSLTWDQGVEMAEHKRVTAATGLSVYFCDPHSPWQRATNENTNGLLRQYFPKGTDLSVHGPGILDNVAAELNSRPRKRHGWRTPAEELDRLLSEASTAGVAPTP